MKKHVKKAVAMGGTLAVAALAALAWILRVKPERILADQVASGFRKAGLERKSVKAAGHEIVYAEGGSGEAVVLLHGYGADKVSWPAFAARLGPSYRIVVPDLPGYGETAPVQGQRYDVASQAARLAAFLDAVGIQKAHLAGNSMGGNIAAIFSGDHPERVSSLALLAPLGAGGPETEAMASFKRGDNLLIVREKGDYERLLRLVFHEKPAMLPGVQGVIERYALAAKPFLERAARDIVSAPAPIDEALGRYQGKLLVMWGDDDRVISPEGAESIRALRPDASFVTVRECGHLPMYERPAESGDAYAAFLAAAGRRR